VKTISPLPMQIKPHPIAWLLGSAQDQQHLHDLERASVRLVPLPRRAGGTDPGGESLPWVSTRKDTAMSYSFKRDDRSVQRGVRRIAVDQIDRAIAEIDEEALDVHETVHQVRKRCKKLRGLLRLVRPSFKNYDDENQTFRDAARSLSFLRDAEAMIETYDDLMALYGERVDRPAFASVRRRLTLRKKEMTRSQDLDAKLAAFRQTMVRARSRANDWHLQDEGFAAIAGGLAKTYGRARRAMADAEARPTAECFHEWRKRVKYHWYHARLLRRTWDAPLQAHADAADDLGDLLGDHHDLAVFRQDLAAAPESYGDPEALEVLAGLIRQRQAQLAAEAFTRGARLLAESEKALARRWGRYWWAWQEEQAVPRLALAG